MSTRWWAPRRASLVPDAVVLALLEPSGQPAGDLGATVLAAHRAGASACEYVAKAGLPSEAALITALAGVRATLADPMVTAISKSMDPSYAGLLVRDVFDDAESAALTLYSAAVAKGVSPPIAVARVGAVFGVPATSMGKYQGMACDPKANPVALTDAADRALMGYVSKLVAAESTQEVSKAAVAFADPEFNPNDHPRGSGGRFVSNVERPSILQPHILAQIRAAGGGGQAAPQVGPKERPAIRKTRATRRTRKVADPEQASKTPVLRGQLAGQLRGQLSPRQSILANAFARMNQPALTPPTKKLPNLLTYPNPKALQNKDAYRDTYYKISHPVIFGVDGITDNDFHNQLRFQANEQAFPETAMFRIGHLLREAGFPQVEKASQNTAAINQITALADTAKAVAGNYVEPYTENINAGDRIPGLESMSEQETDEAMESLRRSRFTTEKTTRLGRQFIEHKDIEDDFVEVRPQYVPLGTENEEDDYNSMFLVHFQPANPNKPRDRPRPTISEYVIEFDAAGKETEQSVEGGRETHLSFELDPNAAYKIVPPPGVHAAKADPKIMWDNDRKVMVNRYYLREIDEAEVNKTLGAEPFHKAETALAFQERAHPRDAFGQWINAQLAAAQSSEPTETIPPAPRSGVRAVRRTRQTRKTRPVAAPEATEATAPLAQAQLRGQLSAATPQGRLSSSLKAALSQHGLEEKQAKGMAVLPPLSESSDYRLMTPEEYSAIEATITHKDLVTMHGGGEVELSKTAVDQITGHTKRHVDELSSAMRYTVDAELDAKQNHLVERAPLSAMPHGMGYEENMVSGAFNHEAVTRRVADLFAADDNLAQIEIEIKGNSFYFYGNAVPASPMVLFQVDPDLKDDEPVVMVWKGEHRAHDVRAQTGDTVASLVDIGFSRYEEAETQNVSNPILNIFKITNPVVHRIVVNNQ